MGLGNVWHAMERDRDWNRTRIWARMEIEAAPVPAVEAKACAVLAKPCAAVARIRAEGDAFAQILEVLFAK